MKTKNVTSKIKSAALTLYIALGISGATYAQNWTQINSGTTKKINTICFTSSTIGYLGGSGKGAQSGLVPVHLHYEEHFNLNGVFVPIDPVVNGSLIDPQKDLTTIVRMQQVDITFKQSKQLPLSRLISETDSTNLPKGDPINDSTQNTNNKSDEK
jgi:hypothetical protein